MWAWLLLLLGSISWHTSGSSSNQLLQYIKLGFPSSPCQNFPSTRLIAADITSIVWYYGVLFSDQTLAAGFPVSCLSAAHFRFLSFNYREVFKKKICHSVRASCEI